MIQLAHIDLSGWHLAAALHKLYDATIVLARFIARVGTVYFFDDSCPVEVPVPKGHSSRLTLHHDLVPCSAQRLTMDDTRVQEVAS